MASTEDGAWRPGPAVDADIACDDAESAALLIWLVRLARDVDHDKGCAGGKTAGLPLTFGGFRLERLLGRGAYGAVFQAIDTRLEKPVALKIAWPEVLADAERSRRFENEPLAMAAIRHRGIVEVYEFGDWGVASYISMELIDGPTLAEWHKTLQSVSETRAADIVCAVAEAVHVAHQANIVHRDLKPSNILLRPTGKGGPLAYEPVVADFGLARRASNPLQSDRTATCAIVGTDHYMSPEQAAGRNDAVGPLSDVYSLGVILYELLCGVCPFAGDSDAPIRERIQTTLPPPPSMLRASLSADLEAIVLKCLEKSPERRYASAQELADDLRRFLDDLPVRAHRIGLLRRGWRFARRKPSQLASASLIVVAAAAIVGLLTAWNQSRFTATPRYADEAAATRHERDVIRRSEYINKIQAAADSLRLGNRHFVVQNRQEASEASGGVDPCGLEWHLLQNAMLTRARELKAHSGGACSVRFSPDGRRLYSAGKDGRIVVWDAHAWTIEQEIVVGDEEVHFAEPSDDGLTLAVGCEAGRVVVYRTNDWSKTFDQQVMAGRIYCIAWLGMNSRLAVAGEGDRVHMLNLDSGETIATPPLCAPSDGLGEDVYADEIESMAFDPDRSQLMVNARPRLQFSLDASTLRVLDARQHRETTYGISCHLPASPDCFAVVCNDAVRIWNSSLAKFVAEVPILSAIRSINGSRDGATLAIGYRNGLIETWDVGRILSGVQDIPRRVFAHDERVLALDFSPDAASLVSCGADGRIRVWDCDTVQRPFESPFQGIIKAVRFSDCGRWLAVVEGRPNGAMRLLMYSAETGEFRWESPLGTLQKEQLAWATFENGWPIDFRPDSSEIAITDGDLIVRTRLVDSGRLTNEFPLSAEAYQRQIQFSPDGEQLIQHPFHSSERVGSWWTDKRRGFAGASPAGERDGWIGSFRTSLGDVWLDQLLTREIVVYRHGTALALTKLAGASELLRITAVSEDGSRIAGGGLDGILFSWDLKDGGRLRKYVGHDGAIADVCYASGDRTLAALSAAGVLRLWDVATGASLMNLGDPAEPIVAMAMHPKGTMLVLAIQSDGKCGLRVHRCEPSGQLGGMELTSAVPFASP
jgi:WD40 repeat protein